MPEDRTLLLVFPDGVTSGQNFEVMERFEKRGLHLIGCKMLSATAEQATAHCRATLSTAEPKMMDETVLALCANPVVVMVWHGPDVFAIANELAAATDVASAVYVSPAAQAAERDIKNWLEPGDVVTDVADEEADESTTTQPKAAPPKADAPPAPTPPTEGAAATAAIVSAIVSAAGGSLSKAAAKKEAKKAEKAAKKEAHKRVAAGLPAEAPKPTISLEPPSGTRDFFPEEMRVRNWLFGKFRETARTMGFQEYDAPVLEYDQLYKRKGGEEITEQMYNFVDKDGKEVTLRPEMTPTLARMILSLGGKILLPVKWFSVPQCWRFETVQRGRKREHFQWNMDIIGEPSIAAEAELLAGITTFFKSLGITSADVGIKVNSRKVLSAILDMYGVSSEQFEAVCVIVDKLDKIGDVEVVKLLEEKAVPTDAAVKIVKSLSLQSVDELKALTGDGGGAAVEELSQLFELAEAYGYRDWLRFDASVVRGLAYYTGIVFEGFDRKGELRAICGGGRYDKLLTLYGAPEPVAACGFGFGDCVIMELLRDKGLLPNLEPHIDFVVVAYNTEMRAHAVSVAARLREAKFAVDVLLEPAKQVKKAFSYADRVCGKRVIFVAPDEWEQGMVRMKDLRTQDENDKQVDLPMESLVDALGKLGVNP